MGIDFRGTNVVMDHARWSYTGFHNFRERLAKEIGLTLDQAQNPQKDDWPGQRDAITLLLNHSDCDGFLQPWACGAIAPRLRELVAAWPEGDYDTRMALTLADELKVCALLGERMEFQ